LKRYCKKQGLELFPISAVTGKGIEELKYAMADKVEEVRLQASGERLQEEPLRVENSDAFEESNGENSRQFRR
jgi:selenocysteine-specific translation elongation factor